MFRICYRQNRLTQDVADMLQAKQNDVNNNHQPELVEVELLEWELEEEVLDDGANDLPFREALGVDGPGFLISKSTKFLISKLNPRRNLFS